MGRLKTLTTMMTFERVLNVINESDTEQQKQ